MNLVDVTGQQAIQAKAGFGGSLGYFGVGHLEFNTGYSFDVSSFSNFFTNSKIILDGQISGSIGVGAAAYAGAQASLGYTSQQLENGFSSETITHSEIALGAGAVGSVTADIPLDSDSSCPLGIKGISGSLGGKIGAGVAGYAGTGVGKAGTYTLPSFGEIYDVLKNSFF